MSSPEIGAAVAAAYSATGGAWEAGPGRIYNRLADVLVSRSPVPLKDRTVLDVGAGTGAASRAVVRAGGRPVAFDVAVGMLRFAARARPPAAAADACALPVRDRAAGGVVAAFSLNHLADPATALRECGRVCSPGSPIIVSAYAADDPHAVKGAVAHALAEFGYRAVDWVDTLYRDLVPRLADPERCVAAATAADLDATASVVEVDFTDLGPDDLVSWRLGMAQHAPFVAGLSGSEREALRHRALDLLGDPEPLVRRIVVTTAVV